MQMTIYLRGQNRTSQKMYKLRAQNKHTLNSFSDIHTLPLGIFTLLLSLIVMITLSIVTLLLRFH